MHGIPELFALQGDTFPGIARNDLTVIGVVSFDELGDEQRAVDLEGDLVFPHRHPQGPLIAHQPLQLGDALGRHDDLGLLSRRKFDVDIDQRQPAAVGGHHGELVFPKREKDAVENVTSFIRGDRIGSLLQRVAQFLLHNGEFLRVLKLRKRREFLLGQTVDLKKALPTPDGSDILGVDLHLDFVGGQFAHDGRQTPRRKRGAAGLIDLGFHHATDADIKIGGGQPQLAVSGLKQHVG